MLYIFIYNVSIHIFLLLHGIYGVYWYGFLYFSVLYVFICAEAGIPLPSQELIPGGSGSGPQLAAIGMVLVVCTTAGSGPLFRATPSKPLDLTRLAGATGATALN